MMESTMPPETAESLVQIGMRAVIRDIQEYIDNNSPCGEDLEAAPLNAHLCAALVAAGGDDEGPRGED